MSLLGVVAGFMTHEFGVAIAELQAARGTIAKLARDYPALEENVVRVDQNVDQLREFVRYTTAYVQGVRDYPAHHTRPAHGSSRPLGSSVGSRRTGT